MSKHKLNKFWARFDLRVALALTVLTAVGLGPVTAIVWAGLMLWSKDFSKRFSVWYQRWMLAGLMVAWLADYRIASALNIPPGWVGLVVVGACAWVALKS